MTCNRDGFQDYYNNFKKTVGNLRDSASKKLQELDLGAEYQKYKQNIHQNFSNFYNKLSTNAEEAKQKLVTYTETKLTELKKVKEEKILQAGKLYNQFTDKKTYLDYIEKVTNEFAEKSNLVKEYASEILTEIQDMYHDYYYKIDVDDYFYEMK
jgi:hypothetical protein